MKKERDNYSLVVSELATSASDVGDELDTDVGVEFTGTHGSGALPGNHFFLVLDNEAQTHLHV